MREVFWVFGYGVPKDIIKDYNYSFYLSIVFNTIYDFVIQHKTTRPIIIFSGGKSDCYKPFERTEGGEMVRWFRYFSKQKHLGKIVDDWTFIAEKEYLSTLENFLRCKEILEKRNIGKASITIFCEKTRESRVKKLAKKVIDKQFQVKINSVDFDVSANRYVEPNFLKDKEDAVLRYDLWALESPQNFKKYHKSFEERIDFLRQAGSKKHIEAVKDWWELKLMYF